MNSQPDSQASLEPLAVCKYSDCKAEISVDEVVKTVAINGSPNHVSLIVKCWSCYRTAQYVMERLRWKLYSTEGLVPTAEELLMREALFELESVDTVDDVVLLFASYGTPRMEVRRGCGCADCQRKYGTGK